MNRSFLCFQKEACFCHTQYPWDDPTNRKAGDLEYSQRHREQRQHHAGVPGQGSLRRGAGDIRSTLSKCRPEPRGPHRLVPLLQHAVPAQKDSSKGSPG